MIPGLPAMGYTTQLLTPIDRLTTIRGKLQAGHSGKVSASTIWQGVHGDIEGLRADLQQLASRDPLVASLSDTLQAFAHFGEDLVGELNAALGASNPQPLQPSIEPHSVVGTLDAPE